MKTEIKIQELSDGRFRNAVTGRIGDSIDAVVSSHQFRDSVKTGEIIMKGKYSIREYKDKSADKSMWEASIYDQWSGGREYDKSGFKTEGEAKSYIKNIAKKKYNGTPVGL